MREKLNPGDLVTFATEDCYELWRYVEGEMEAIVPEQNVPLLLVSRAGGAPSFHFMKWYVMFEGDVWFAYEDQLKKVEKDHATP